ncbi:NAD-dependent protein deacylase [Roseomonas sp. SSH11]|uniref:NAD-dependent protein deacylase n=1 Tax=Pararoseomonas baculiformis TaxID=2820812 RepID=A0ABS4ACX3_9PROT|nr:Sir2 family NAD+-dependent deacetylase [Pararoseomonas baculiformis]MBP0444858.1 NAD-dependent protein deacylase [Pararoseomonas baculiformis]
MAPPKIVILTGAGISRESGLHTFRDPDGIWARHRIEDVATPEAFARTPALVQGFYNARRAQLRDPAIRPNAAHEALAELDARWPGELLLVTQNVDDLHDRAGSRRLIHMHGELAKARCLRCEGVSPAPGDLTPASTCPDCDAAGSLRPHVVWFGEMPLEMERIGQALEGCDLFVSIGTSGAVYPAAGFVREVRHRADTLELNLEPSEGSHLFDEARHGPATQLVPAFVRDMLARWA